MDTSLRWYDGAILKTMILAIAPYCLALFLITPAQAAPLPTVTVTPSQQAIESRSLDDVITWLHGVTTLVADFKQTTSSGKISHGKMTLARPGKVRFEYEPSVPVLVVADGGSLYVVDYGNASVQRYPIKNSPLSVLLDPKADIKRIAKLVEAGPAAVPGYTTIEATDPKRPQYGTITLYFANTPGTAGNVTLSAWRVLDAQGNTTTIQLDKPRLNGSVPEGAFTYKDPRRAQVGGRTH